VYCASGIDESTRDVVFDGHMMIGENGTILKENERYESGTTMLVTDVDLQRVLSERRNSNSEAENKRRFRRMTRFSTVEFEFGAAAAPLGAYDVVNVPQHQLANFDGWEMAIDFGHNDHGFYPMSVHQDAAGKASIWAGGATFNCEGDGVYQLRKGERATRAPVATPSQGTSTSAAGNTASSAAVKADATTKPASKSNSGLLRYFSPKPFVPSASAELNKRCKEIFKTTTAGLRKRLLSVSKRTGKKEVTIGISGGLDSTLALMTLIQVFDQLGWSRKGILAYTMPGYGTTDRTKGNAHKLMKLLGVTALESDIRATCFLQWRSEGYKPFGIDLKEISNQARRDYLAGLKSGAFGEDEDIDLTDMAVEIFTNKLKDLPDGVQDLKFENTQARARTEVLMNNGFVIGTGDLSEIALGWCTYNGDHTSMYNVNCSIPKTLVKFLVNWAADVLFTGDISAVLKDIVATKISPELLPTGKDGQVKQVTEDSVGPYELHDYFMYWMIRWGMSPEKILFQASFTDFEGGYSQETIERWLKAFIKRFFIAQFKRSAVPDGPKVGTISLSPRGDWRMPTDADWTHWLAWAGVRKADIIAKEGGDVTSTAAAPGTDSVPASTATSGAAGTTDGGKNLVQIACDSGACADPKANACFGTLPVPVDTEEEKSALLAVDAINAFGSKKHGGELCVESGEEVGPIIGEIQDAEVHDEQVAGNDEHEDSMFNFIENNPPGTEEVLDKDGVPTKTWTKHGVKNTWGAQFLPGIRAEKFSRIFPKGDDPRKDSNSACGNKDLVPWLRERGIKRVDVCGLVRRICVGLTVLDLVKEGFRVRLIVDATRDIELPEWQWVMDAMKASPMVEFVTVEQVLAEKKKTK
jgi:NH3-dependent NAD+ synthetase/nicotinamidase-related amidase